MKTFTAAVISILITAASFVPSAQARPITGSIDFGGVVTFDSTSLSNATRVNLWNSSFVLQDSGDFSSIAPGTNVTMAAPWIFNPSTNTPSLWTVGNFKFDLTSCVIVSQSPTFLNITGIGTISSTVAGLDPTPGTWSFTASDANGQPQATFGFQTQTAAVPEPGTLTLLAIGAGGLISSRRRRAR